MEDPAEYDYICPVCQEVFTVPVILSCSHSFCQECISRFWRGKRGQQCPVCRKSSRHQPPVNLALKNLCESFLSRRSERRAAAEDTCASHGEPLKLFCLQDLEPVCVVCFTSQQHDHHRCRPVSEVVSPYKEELHTILKSQQEKLRLHQHMREEMEKTQQHIEAQAENTKRLIRQQFEKLHQFLRDEETASITALREEEEQKKQTITEKLEEINRRISTLSDAVSHAEEMMKARDIRFLKEFPGSVERVRISEPDPEMPSGALIHVSRHLSNLTFRVWEKMKDIVQHTPVTLDPLSSHPALLLSDDLTQVRWSWNTPPCPDNPERFDFFPAVLGSEGFSSGSHRWEVEVKDSSDWVLGVCAASCSRKGCVFFQTGVWSVWFDQYSADERPVLGCRVQQKLQRVRVDLDWDRGTLMFSDPLTHTHIHTFTAAFTHTLVPFFCCYTIFALRILPLSSS